MINILGFLLTSFCLLFVGCQKVDEKANQLLPLTPEIEEQTINICVFSPDNTTTQIDTKRLPSIKKIKITSPQKAWILTGFGSGNIFSTNNSGKYWTKLEIQENSDFNAFDFLDEQNGWVSDYKNNIWKTTDGGKNWTKFSPFTKVIEEKNFLQSNQIEFSSVNNGWLRDDFKIYQTNDSGVSWKPVNSVPKQPQTMFFFKNSGWIVFDRESPDSSLIIAATLNNGISWRNSKIERTDTVQSIFFLDENNGWISAFSNKLFSTKNAGKSWEETPLREKDFQIKSIYWLNSKEGWLAGAIVNPDKPDSDDSANIPTLLYTKDSGETWSKSQPKEAKRFFNQVYFENSNTGWLTSKDKIYKTEDGGNSWKSILKVNITKNCN